MVFNTQPWRYSSFKTLHLITAPSTWPPVNGPLRWVAEVVEGQLCTLMDVQQSWENKGFTSLSAVWQCNYENQLWGLFRSRMQLPLEASRMVNMCSDSKWKKKRKKTTVSGKQFWARTLEVLLRLQRDNNSQITLDVTLVYECWSTPHVSDLPCDT